MALEVEGKLYRKFDTERKTESFQTREFVLEIESGNYPQLIKFQIVQDKCTILDNYAEGSRLKVHFDLRGREWQGKFLTNLNAWRIEAGDAAPAAAGAPVPSTPTASSTPRMESFPTAEPPGLDAANDDLPF